MAKQLIAFVRDILAIPIGLNWLSKVLTWLFSDTINYRPVQFTMWTLTVLNCWHLEARVNRTESVNLWIPSLVRAIGIFIGVAAMRDNAEGDQTTSLKWEFRTWILVNLFLYRALLPNLFFWFDMAAPDEDTIQVVLGQLFRLLLFLDPSRIYSLLGLLLAITFNEHVEMVLRVLTRISGILGFGFNVSFLRRWSWLPMIKLLELLERVDFDWIPRRESSYTEYKHTPLGPRQIRLLKIHKWNPLGRMRCEFLTVSVDRAPPYEAISHTWGTTYNHTDILINDVHRLAVPERIYRFLKYRRTFVSSKLIWVDGLCIDQKNLDEKAQQVRIMGDVFSNASRVLIWLATPEEAPDSALMAQAALLIRYASKAGAQAGAAALNVLLEDYHWTVLRKFFSDRWFSRVWMVQEVALPRKVHVVYGRACLVWEQVEIMAKVTLDPSVGGRMEDMLRMINGSEFLRRSRNIGNVGIMSLFRRRILNDRRRIRGQPDPLRVDGEQFGDSETISSLGFVDLETLLVATREFDSTVAEDKVFAVLGMVLDTAALSRLPTPDYQSEFYHTYHQTAALLLRTGKSPAWLLIIAGVGLRRFQGVEAKHHPPSWVPDFRAPIGRLSAVNIPEHLVEPQGEGGLQVSLGQDSNSLELSVCFVDEIIQVGPLHQHPNIYDNNVEGLRWQQAMGYTLSWIRATKEMALRNIDDETRPHDTLTDDFWRALFLNRITGPLGETEISEDQLLFVKETLEHVCETYAREPADEDELRTFVEQSGKQFVPLIRSLNLTSFGRSLCRTRDGRFAMAPPLVEKGDVVCFFKGSDGPWLLRPVERTSESDRRRYQFVGSCYVHKLQYPEAGAASEFQSVIIM